MTVSITSKMTSFFGTPTEENLIFKYFSGTIVLLPFAAMHYEIL